MNSLSGEPVRNFVAFFFLCNEIYVEKGQRLHK